MGKKSKVSSTKQRPKVAPRKRQGGSGEDSAPSARERTGVVRYVCAHCGGEMKINQSKSYPSFLARRFRCMACGRMSDVVKEMRETKTI